MSNLYRGPSKDASYQVSIHLAKLFQRRRLFRNQPIRNKNVLWHPCLDRLDKKGWKGPIREQCPFLAHLAMAWHPSSVNFSHFNLLWKSWCMTYKYWNFGNSVAIFRVRDGTEHGISLQDFKHPMIFWMYSKSVQTIEPPNIRRM
jgi:hypothetical protein